MRSNRFLRIAIPVAGAVLLAAAAIVIALGLRHYARKLLFEKGRALVIWPYVIVLVIGLVGFVLLDAGSPLIVKAQSDDIAHQAADDSAFEFLQSHNPDTAKDTYVITLKTKDGQPIRTINCKDALVTSVTQSDHDANGSQFLTGTITIRPADVEIT